MLFFNGIRNAFAPWDNTPLVISSPAFMFMCTQLTVRKKSWVTNANDFLKSSNSPRFESHKWYSVTED